MLVHHCTKGCFAILDCNTECEHLDKVLPFYVGVGIVVALTLQHLYKFTDPFRLFYTSTFRNGLGGNWRQILFFWNILALNFV